MRHSAWVILGAFQSVSQTQKYLIGNTSKMSINHIADIKQFYVMFRKNGSVSDLLSPLAALLSVT